MNLIAFDSQFKLRWNFVVLLSIIASLVIVPYEVIFVHAPSTNGTVWYYLLSAIFIIDIWFNFNTTVKRGTNEIADRSIIRKLYLSGHFWIDVFSIFPFELFFLGSDSLIFNEPVALIVRLNVLFRFRRFYDIFKQWQVIHWLNPRVLRLARFLVSMLVLIHLVACAWFWTAYSKGFPEESWVALEGLTNSDAITQYVRSLYWTVTTMTTIGYGDITPHTNLEYGFVTMIMLLGATMYAYIIGNVASILNNIDVLKTEHHAREESLIQYLKENNAPKSLIDKVSNYFNFIWQSKKGVNEKEIFNDLPEQLRLELMSHISQDLMNNVFILRESSKGLRLSMLAKMHLINYPPNVVLSHDNTFSNGIYFISKGSLIVQDAALNEKSKLKNGECFGLIPMILNEMSTCTVVTEEYCEVFYLSRKDFLDLKNQSDEFNELLKKSAQNKSEKDLELFMEGIIL